MTLSTSRPSLPSLAHERKPAAAPPHRSHRRLPLQSRPHIIASIGALLLVQAAVTIVLPYVANFASAVSAAVLDASGLAVAPADERLLWMQLAPVGFNMRVPDYLALIFWIAGPAAGAAAASRFGFVGAHVKNLVVLNAAAIGLPALYMFMTGYGGYDAGEFSRLYWRTAVLVWLLMPLAVGAITMLFPFSALERVGIVTCALAYDVALSALRYTVVIWLLAKFGAVLMVALYLLYGPLLDFIAVSGVLALFLVRLANRLNRQTWSWSWL